LNYLYKKISCSPADSSMDLWMMMNSYVSWMYSLKFVKSCGKKI